jgi:hypothetical protein
MSDLRPDKMVPVERFSTETPGEAHSTRRAPPLQTPRAALHDRAPLGHRAAGAAVLLVALGVGYWCLRVRFTTLKLLATVPLAAAAGLWVLVFGYPRRADGMTPAWWRLGLLVTAIAFLAATLEYFSD